MTTSFPTGLDTFPAAATLAGHQLSTDPHSALHGNLGDSVAALEAKVGIDASAVTTSLDYNVKNLKPGMSHGRLTLTTGVPVTTADVTGATTVYYTPYKGNGVSLYSTSATKWFSYTFAEISASLAGLTLSVPTDVFAYWTGSAVALELVNWTNGTTRATALALQDGVRVKNGDATRLYLGTLAGSGAGTCEDSLLNRLVYNYYNQKSRGLKVIESTTTWTYSLATWRSMNGSNANRVNVVSGTGEDLASLMVACLNITDVAGNRQNGIGVDSTTAPTWDMIAFVAAANQWQMSFSNLQVYTPIGFHYYQALEYGVGSGTQTWFSNGSFGIVASYVG